MRRRELMLGIGGAIFLPLALGAQQKAMPVIGWLGSTAADPVASFVAAFRQGLAESGYVEGQNLAIEYRWANGQYERLPALAAELVTRKVAKAATSTIPIVFASGDPVEGGLVASLSRPGGNLTGVSLLGVELMPKRLEQLSELVPQARTIAVLVNPNGAFAKRIIADMEGAAHTKGVQLDFLNAGSESDVDGAFATLAKRKAGALLVGADPFFTSRRDQIVALATRYAVPGSYGVREFVAIGGLMSYGLKITAAFREFGIYAGKILSGVSPADLPVAQPTRFELVINMKTAQALRLTVPPLLLATADEVIE